MNHLQDFEQLRNDYYSLRHGKGYNQETGIIVSDPEVGVPGYGLVHLGRKQVRDSITRAVDEGLLDDSVVIVSSDFLRARESADIAHEVTHAMTPVQLTTKLRERFFGDLDGKGNVHYRDVWARDAVDSSHTDWGVESADAVQSRTTSMVVDLEQVYSGRTIILAGHGDSLQIGETGFQKISPRLHRQLPPLQNAELRRLNLKV